MLVRFALIVAFVFILANDVMVVTSTTSIPTKENVTTFNAATPPEITTEITSISPDSTTTTTKTTTSTEETTTMTSETTTSTTEATTTATPSPDGIPTFAVEQDGIFCLILKANLQLFVNYFNSTSSLTKALAIGSDAKVMGTCKADEETMMLQWTPGPLDIPFNLTLKLVRLPKSPSKFGGSVVQSVDFEYFLSDDVFPSTNVTGSASASTEGSFFETPDATGYTCTSQQNISMLSVILGISSLHLEAFRNSSSRDFSEKVFDCVDIPSSNKVVPIIVGVTAAILILLAVVAFFVGNRRRAQGYQAL